MREKVKFAFCMTPELREELESRYTEDGSTSQTTFVERAVRFYLDYLSAGKSQLYLPDAIRTVMEGQMGLYEQRLSALLFKQAAEMDMMMRTLCDTVDLPEEYLQKQRARSIKSVKATNGQLRLEQVAKEVDESRC